MKKLLQPRNIIIPVAALVAGLMIGLGVGQIQIKKEQKVYQDKIKETSKKAAYFQQKIAEEKNEAMVALEQQEQKCRGDLNKLQIALKNEKNVLEAQLGKFQEQTQKLEKLELKIKESDAAFAKTKQELQVMERNNKDLDHELKKTTAEKQALQAELKKTTRDLVQCSSNNAELCIIAEELVKKYRNKGIGAAILEKEPLIQVKKVELEQFVQKYQEEIEQLKTKKNVVEGKHVDE